MFQTALILCIFILGLLMVPMPESFAQTMPVYQPLSSTILAITFLTCALALLIFLVMRHKKNDFSDSSLLSKRFDELSASFSQLLQTETAIQDDKVIQWLMNESHPLLTGNGLRLFLLDRAKQGLQETYATPMEVTGTCLELASLQQHFKKQDHLITDQDHLKTWTSTSIPTSTSPTPPHSLLLVKIGLGEDFLGLLQYESDSEAPPWSRQELHFAKSIADLLALHLATRSCKQLETDLIEREKRFHDIIEVSSDWYWETDRNHCFSYFSPKFSALTGISPESLLGKTRHDFSQPELLDRKWAHHWEDLQNHRPFRNFQYAAYLDGHDISVIINGTPYFDKEGSFLGYRGTGSDVTDSTSFKARFEESINALPNGFLLWDSSDRLLMWNQILVEMFPDLTPYANRTLTYEDLLKICAEHNLIKFERPLTPPYLKAMVQAHLSCGTRELELTNGKYLLVHEHAMSEGSIVSIYTDITAIKAREKELIENKRISEIISECSNALFHARNESFILSEICRIIISDGLFESAWISLFNTPGLLPEFLKINMARGIELDSLEHRPSSILKQFFIKQEPLHLDKETLLKAFPNFRDQLNALGIQSAGLFPIWSDTQMAGFLTITSTSQKAFEDKYINLFNELSKDVGYGLANLRSEHSRLDAEEALRESEGRYRSLIDMSPDAIVVLDKENQVIFANPAGHVLFATTNRAEILHRPFEAFLEEEIETFKQVPLFTPDEPTQSFSSIIMRRLNGTLFEADITSRPVSYLGNTTRLLIIRDVTERNRVNENLAQTSKLATLGEMAAGITHELSQPLNIMRFAAEGSMLKMQRDTISREDIQKQFNLISMQSGRMADIIDHMRVFSRKDTGPIEYFDPTVVVRQSVDLVESQYLAEDIHIDVRYPPHYGLLKGRPIQLEQVVLNLINNARDAINERHKDLSEEEKETKRINVIMTYDQADDLINIAITDNGGGIPKDSLSKLFDPFFTTKEVGKGTGLGLSVSYGIIAAMDGMIRARNIHKGARFDITLPCTSAKTKNPPLYSAKKVTTPAPVQNLKTVLPPIDESAFEDEDDDLDLNLDGAKILVVDDEIYAAEAMMEYLFDHGYQVNIAGNGEEALELFEAEPVDLVITDMRMPKMDGYTLIKNLNRQAPALPVIMVTGHTGMEEVGQDDLHDLAFGVLKKPVSLSHLNETVEKALQSIEKSEKNGNED